MVTNAVIRAATWVPRPPLNRPPGLGTSNGSTDRPGVAAVALDAAGFRASAFLCCRALRSASFLAFAFCFLSSFGAGAGRPWGGV
ncbi:hypothetical protein [Streptomyces sp. NPDC054865]